MLISSHGQQSRKLLQARKLLQPLVSEADGLLHSQSARMYTFCGRMLTTDNVIETEVAEKSATLNVICTSIVNHFQDSMQCLQCREGLEDDGVTTSVTGQARIWRSARH